MASMARSPLLLAWLRRFRRDARGVTAVEFALIAPVLILFMMGIVELGLIMMTQGIMDNAAFSASRAGKTGYAAAGMTQDQTIMSAVTKSLSGVLSPAKLTLTSKAYDDYGSIGQPEPFTDVNNNGRYDAGEPYTDVNGNGSWDADQGKTGAGTATQIVVYTVSYKWKLFTPLIARMLGSSGVVPIDARVVVRNEPYE